MNVNKHVALATAEQHKSAKERWDTSNIPLKFRAGGRVGTINMTLHNFAKRLGNPHEAVPPEDWRNYKLPLLDGAGKISALWFFETPRGPLQVGDYWWNKEDELSIRAPDKRALIWFKRWCRKNDIPIA